MTKNVIAHNIKHLWAYNHLQLDHVLLSLNMDQLVMFEGIHIQHKTFVIQLQKY